MKGRRWYWGGLLIIFMGAALLVYTYGRARPGVTLEGRPVGGKVRGEIEDLIGELARDRECLPENANINIDSGKIIPDRPGITIDTPRTLWQVMRARPGEDVGLVTREIKAKITRVDIGAKIHTKGENLQPLGGGVTAIYDDSPERVHNIKLATDYITNISLSPGEEFTFSRVVGNPTRDKGFREAPIIDDAGQFTPRVGGGICQVSSTLYQAACAAGLEVIERHAHSQKVEYTPQGSDAAVVPGEKDLRFRNSHRGTIHILGSASAGEVRFVILARE